MKRNNLNKPKALVIIYTARDLQEFLWLYCLKKDEYSWIAVCCPYGNKKCSISMDSYCRRADIFDEVIVCNTHFNIMKMKEKIVLFLKMLLNFIIGRRRKYCAEIVRQCVGDINYSAAVVSSDYGILTGSLIANAKYKQVYILEDGMGDYRARPKGYIFSHLNNKGHLTGFLLAKMGYVNPAFMYRFKDTKYCDKYSSYPEKMEYTNYRSIKKLFSEEKINQEYYTQLVKCTFNITDNYDNYDAMLLTVPLDDFTPQSSKYIKSTEKYINNHLDGKKLLVKKHPRDSVEYQFSGLDSVQTIDGSVPAEILIPLLKSIEIIAMFPSSVLMSTNNEECKILYYPELEKENEMLHYDKIYKDVFQQTVSSFATNSTLNIQIITLKTDIV